MRFQYDDGGRAEAGYKGSTGDCVTRAIAIATGLPYQAVYERINTTAQQERPRRGRKQSSARTGVFKGTIRKLLTELGWTWHPTMSIGSGCRVHLVAEELPAGRLIVSVSKHMVAVLDHVVHDTHDPQREMHCIDPDHGQPLKPGQWRNENGVCSIQRRCVYGYWTPA
jgi:hypothetical protein